MDYVNKLEKVLAGWYKKAPHLPKKANAWIIENMWWLALVTVILLVCGMFILIPILFTVIAMTPTTTAWIPYIPYYQTAFGLTWLGLSVFVLSFVITSVLVAYAVTPLRERSKKGWDLVFWGYLSFVFLNLVASLLMSNTVVLLNVAIDAVVGGYLLFEIRDQLAGQHKTAHKKA
jgi:hypothetical protein